MIGRGPKRVTSACDTPAQTTTVPAVARNVSPAFSADQCRTCCTYNVRMKKFAKIAAPKSTDTMFAAVTDAVAEDLERHQRRPRPSLGDEECGEERRGENEETDRSERRPTDERRLRDRVHQNREARRNAHCACRVEA